MATFYGPLVHRAPTGDTATVIDPRFGVGATPAQPSGWTGGGVVDAEVYVQPTDPTASVAPGTEFVWFKTDGDGTLLDILSGRA